MKRCIKAAKTMFDKQAEKLLEELTLDMLYQVWENYPEYCEDDAYECTLEHVIWVITEMDDDSIYESLIPFADYDNKEFCNVVRSIVDNHYDDYHWYVEYDDDCDWNVEDIVNNIY